MTFSSVIGRVLVVLDRNYYPPFDATTRCDFEVVAVQDASHPRHSDRTELAFLAWAELTSTDAGDLLVGGLPEAEFVARIPDTAEKILVEGVLGYEETYCHDAGVTEYDLDFELESVRVLRSFAPYDPACDGPVREGIKAL